MTNEDGSIVVGKIINSILRKLLTEDDMDYVAINNTFDDRKVELYKNADSPEKVAAIDKLVAESKLLVACDKNLSEADVLTLFSAADHLIDENDLATWINTRTLLASYFEQNNQNTKGLKIINEMLLRIKNEVTDESSNKEYLENLIVQLQEMKSRLDF